MMKNSSTTGALKTQFLSEAIVEYETKVKEANGELYKKQKEAEAILYEKEKEAEAQKAMAEASLYVRQQEAQGELYAKKKEGQGLIALAQAQDAYLQTLLQALGGNYAALRDYLIIDRRALQDIAAINAASISCLRPKISVWSTENGNDNEQNVDGKLFSMVDE